MKRKWSLIGSIVELIFGLLGILSFIFLLAVKYNRDGTLMFTLRILECDLCIYLLVSGIIGIIRYVKQNKQK